MEREIKLKLNVGWLRVDDKSNEPTIKCLRMKNSIKGIDDAFCCSSLKNYITTVSENETS